MVLRMSIENLYANCILHIKKSELDPIVNSLQCLQDANLKNTELLNLLSHLAYCANHCFTENISKEHQVFKIASKICHLLTDTRNKRKLISAIYYIVQYLLKESLFREASVITEYLFPERILKNHDYLNSSEYCQIANLWYSAITRRLATYGSMPHPKHRDESFLNYIDFQLQILEHCDDAPHYTLEAADAYTRKISCIASDDASSCFFKLFTCLCFHLSKHLKSSEKSVAQKVVNTLISIFGHFLFKNSNAIKSPKILCTFRQCDRLIFEFLQVSQEYQDCYKFFSEYACSLLETNIMIRKVGEAHFFKKTLKNFQGLLEEYGASNCTLIGTVITMANSFEALFTNLESIVGNPPSNTKISQDDLLRLGELVGSVFSIVSNNEFPKIYKCAKCPRPTKCLVKKDMFSAGCYVFLYLKIIARFPHPTLTENLFKLAMDLMEKILSAFHELHESGCLYSVPMWNKCAMVIFNIGLFNEKRYPAEIEKFYEELCKWVISFDGLNGQVNGFGLKNPASAVLYRLSFSLFNQGRYKEALIHTAYSALISTDEIGKSRAYYLWADIKMKCIDVREMQELTLLQCLKSGESVMEQKFDLHFNLEDYDLVDACLREIESLYGYTVNFDSLIKKILEYLESIGDGVAYAKGVLLLCFHVLPFEYCKREIISDGILHAIKRLGNQNPKTLEVQCLEVNLHFFKTIEKLYVRNQDIKDQINDAEFQRAFTQYQGPGQDKSRIRDKVLSICKKINLEEQNKVVAEFQKNLALWADCLQNKDIVSIWKPSYTLETIIICGEYCRLYKFALLENKCWKLSYSLASALQDYMTCSYITSRSISLRCIHDEWITYSKTHAEKMKSSTKMIENRICMLFWLSSADLYLDCNKVDDAKILLQKVKSMPKFNYLDNPRLYVYALDIQFRNYLLLNETTSQESYVRLLAEMHYLLIDLYRTPSRVHWDIRYSRFNFFSSEQLFECLCNMVVPMISLVSINDPIGHLYYQGLRSALSLGLAMRVAEVLKYFCHIDLLRLDLVGCEMKLQALDQILSLHFHEMQCEMTPSRYAPKTVHDGVAGGAKPQQGTEKHDCKLLALPGFASNEAAFACSNVAYKQLCFSSFHLRGHMYSLMSIRHAAEHHFNGAAKVGAHLDEIGDPDSARSHPGLELAWRRSPRHIADALQFRIDLACHLFDDRPGYEEDAALLVDQVIEMNEKYRLGKTSVLHQAVELYAQRCIYTRLPDRSAIMVPDPRSFDDAQEDSAKDSPVQLRRSARIANRKK